MSSSDQRPWNRGALGASVDSLVIFVMKDLVLTSNFSSAEPNVNDLSSLLSSFALSSAHEKFDV